MLVIRLFYATIFILTAMFWLPDFSKTLDDLITPGFTLVSGDKDFANYWIAAKLALDGLSQQLYRLETYFPMVQEIMGEDITIKNWSYPPHILIFLSPLGLLEYKAAIFAFFVSGIFFYFWAAQKFFQEFGNQDQRLIYWVIHISFVFMTLIYMQNGYHLAALALFGFLYMKKTPLIAGICFAVLTVKPQLGILIPFLLIFCQAWRCIIFSSLFTCIFIGLSILLFGIDDWFDYIEHTAHYQSAVVMQEWTGIFLHMMPSIFANMRVIGVDASMAFNIHLVAALIFLPIILWAMYKEKDTLNRIFIVLIGTFILSPYSFNYDMGAFVTLCAIFATRYIGKLPNHAILWGALLASVLFMAQLSLLGLPILPIILGAGFLLFVWDNRSQKTRQPNISS